MPSISNVDWDGNHKRGVLGGRGYRGSGRVDNAPRGQNLMPAKKSFLLRNALVFRQQKTSLKKLKLLQWKIVRCSETRSARWAGLRLRRNSLPGKGDWSKKRVFLQGRNLVLVFPVELVGNIHRVVSVGVAGLSEIPNSPANP